MKLKIVSDGTPAGTRLEDEHGNGVDGVTSLSWEMDAEFQEAAVRVELARIPVELAGEVTDVSVPPSVVALLDKSLEGLGDEQLAAIASKVETQRLRRLARFVSAPFKAPTDT